MSSRHAFRGSRGRGRGRRSYSDSPSGEYTPQFVSGDSHFEQVEEANRGFRPQYNRGNYQNVPPPSSYHNPPSFNHPYRPPQPPAPYFNLNQQFRRPWQQQQQQQPPPPFNQNQQFYRPRQQFKPQQQQQLRPRPPKQLEYRNWEYAKPGPPPECERFTLISYNILADYLATDHRRELYFHIPRYILDWEHRKRSIVFELGLWSADILCLQEVDKFLDLKEQLELRGYSGIWKMRTGEPIDGCATFWRNSRFKLLHEESLEFSKLGLRDNVAQICVFKSLEQCKNDVSASTTSLGHANKIVVCNIHVLFNPKRGEIKLGQIRVLFNRAHAVSKLWDDAPLIICGDFNCTPKSPLYNFIAEQKLDLSELARDKVSGQASATIHFPRPYNPSNPNFAAQCADNSAQVLPAPSDTKAMNSDSPMDLRKPENPEKILGNELSMNNLCQPQLSVVKESGDAKGSNDKALEKCDLHLMDGCSLETKPAISNSQNVSEESPCLLSGDDASSVCLNQDSIHYLNSQECRPKDIYSKLTQVGHEENEYHSSSEICSSSSVYLCSDSGEEYESNCMKSELSIVAESHGNSIDNYEYTGASSLVISSTEKSCPLPSLNSVGVSVASSGDLLSPSAQDLKGCILNPQEYSGCKVSCESTSSDFLLDGEMKSLSLNEELEGTKGSESPGEDDSTFLSELHNSAGPFPTYSSQYDRSHLEGLDDSFKECTSSPSQDLHPDDTLNSNPDVVSERIAMEKSKYDCSAWTPAEIEKATGTSDCTVLEHPLELKSVYGEVQDYQGTRDSAGEPAVTSYHKRFLGTVDYIWRSEGLQTARVLAPIPKHAMLWTRGFPTKKWGSDHIALVSELAFTRDTINQDTGVQIQNNAQHLTSDIHH